MSNRGPYSNRKRSDRKRSYLWLICYLAAFHPNCTRCCKENGSCKYAWEDCPASSCNSCKFGSTIESTDFFEAGAGGFHALEAGSLQSQPIALEAKTVADPPGGTIAFVQSSSGTFVVAAVPASDSVHIVRIEAAKWDEDPLTLRTIGDVALSRGDEPGRVIADAAGRAHVILRRGGAIVTIDPVSSAVVDRRRVCAAPHGLAYDRTKELLHVACSSGEILTLSAETSQEVKHQFVDRGLEDIAVSGDFVVASTRTRLIAVSPDGSLAAHETRSSLGALRSSPTSITLAFTNDKTAFATLTSEGTIGPWMAVRDAATAVSDLDVASDGTVAIVAGGDAFLLSSGSPAFVPLGVPGIARAVALGEITTGDTRRRVIVVQTDSPRLLVFFTVPITPSAVTFEPL